jgi:glycosyltransferase involved in cell wall biosynthesis
MKPLTIIIPAYNEASTISRVLEQVKAGCQDFVEEIIVVDDGSEDNTSQLAKEAGVHVIRHARNVGYGQSLKTGIRAAKTEFILTMDSDGQHRVEDVRRLWERVSEEDDRPDMIVGQRTSLLHSPLWRMPGKWLLSLMANYLVRYHIPDLNSGLRLARRDVLLKYLHICPSGFSFSTTITMALLSQGYNVIYVPITVEKRQGKSTVSIATGFETILLILRIATLFDPLRIFIPASFFAGAVGVIWGIPYALSGRGVSVGAMLAIVTAVLMFSLGLIVDQISQLRLERYE